MVSQDTWIQGKVRPYQVFLAFRVNIDLNINIIDFYADTW